MKNDDCNRIRGRPLPILGLVPFDDQPPGVGVGGSMSEIVNKDGEPVRKPAHPHPDEIRAEAYKLLRRAQLSGDPKVKGDLTEAAWRLLSELRDGAPEHVSKRMRKK